MESFYIDSLNFIPYGFEHALSMLAMTIFGAWFLYMGKHKWNQEQKWRYAIIFSAVLYGIQIGKTLIRVYLGNFDKTEDLPFHLCNMLPLLMVLGLLYKNRTLLSVIFFWILAGTFQANITPTLLNVLPHYEAIRYWTIHMGLPIIAVYTVYALDFKYTFSDVIRSGLSLNILAAIIYPLNLLIGSNYLYLNALPPPGTIYDYLGPWPWYILSLEGVMILLFSIVLLIVKLFSFFANKSLTKA